MINIYKVQSAALAPGVYNCYRQKLLASAWQAGYGDKFADAEETPIPVEILNLLENNTLPNYTCALASGDPIAAWPITDCAGESRLVGRPITSDVRRFVVKEDAGSEQFITCNIIANDGETEIESGLGSGIEVHFKICLDSDLNEASPNLTEGEKIIAHNEQGKWWCDTIFQGRDDTCICEAE